MINSYVAGHAEELVVFNLEVQLGILFCVVVSDLPLDFHIESAAVSVSSDKVVAKHLSESHWVGAQEDSGAVSQLEVVNVKESLAPLNLVR